MRSPVKKRMDLTHLALQVMKLTHMGGEVSDSHGKEKRAPSHRTSS